METEKINKYLVRTADSLEADTRVAAGADTILIALTLFAALAIGALAMWQDMKFMQPFNKVLAKAKAQGWKPGKRLPDALLAELIDASENIPSTKMAKIKAWAKSRLSQKQLEQAGLNTTLVDLQERALEMQQKTLNLDQARYNRSDRRR